ncbi:hypothetical protein PC39_14737 [Salinisphaera sp. PC39]|uniref:DUF72 domain-containing protein n=1 Tax=Salinisphaera sp. PC39 TaxID=1304156 RepID=UPI00333E331A
MSRGAFRVGTSGYQYRHWRGAFYPRKLAKKDWFAHYAGRFDTVEINNTFYNLPAPETFDAWRAAAPAGFVYALKFSRYGSHIKRLKDPGNTVTRFLERADRLGDALGPILVQLPGNWRPDIARLRDFLAALPAGRRWAFEFRDPRWHTDAVLDLLAAHDAALCEHDMGDERPPPSPATWRYLRFHGDHYQGSYSPQYLGARARVIRRDLAAGRDVYAFFNNDADGHAPADAQRLRRYVTAARG